MNPLIRNRNMVDALASAVRGGSQSLGQVPGLLCHVIEQEAWRHFTTALGKEVMHARLADFITAPPLDGLGASVDLVRKIIAEDSRALDLLDQALQNPVGTNVAFDNIQEHAPTGTSRTQALRKLRAEAERGNEQAVELHAEVLAGRLSAHAAMVQAGFRPKMISVPVGKPDRVAQHLRKHMAPEHLAILRGLLSDDEPAF